MIVKTSVEYISPERAKQLLENNYERNRRVRKTWVSTLAEMMQAGDFRSMNGQNTIIVGTDGKLYDGQHRLLAIIESGVTLPFLVCTSDSPIEDYATYDYTQVRRASDIVDAPNSNSVCAIAKLMIAIEYGNAGIGTVIIGRKDVKNVISRTDITSYANANKDNVCRIARSAMRIRDNIGVGAVTAYGLFIALVEYVHDDGFLQDFIDEVCSVDTSNKTILALREIIRKSYASTKKPTKAYLVGLLLCAYSHYKELDDVITLNKGRAYLERYSKMMQKERENRREAGNDDC